MSAAAMTAPPPTAAVVDPVPKSMHPPFRRRTRLEVQYDMFGIFGAISGPEISASCTGRAGWTTIPKREAQKQLNVSRRELRQLIQAGAIGNPVPGMASLPHNASLATVFSIFCRSFRPEPNRRALRLYADVRDICGTRADNPPPDSVLEVAGALLLQAGGVHRVDELAAILRMPRHAADKALARLAILLAKPRDPGATAMPSVPWTMAMIVAAVPNLAGAPETCLDPEPREVHDEPGLLTRARLSAMKRVIGPASLFAIVAAASMRREERLEHHLLMVQRFGHWYERIAPAANHRDTQAIGRTLDYIAFSPELDGVIPPGVRDAVCRSWLMLTDVNYRYARGADRAGLRGLRELVPARHPDEAGFRMWIGVEKGPR